MNRSRILMLLYGPAGKGAYWRAYHFGRELSRRGHDVTLLAMSPRHRWRLTQQVRAGVTLVEAPDLLWGALRSGWDPWQVVRRLLWLRGRPFDLVHLFDCRPTGLLPALWLRRRPVPLVIDWGDWFGRGGSVEERPNPVVRALLRPVETYFEERFRTRADATTVICRTLAQKAIGLGVPADTVTLIRDGCDVQGVAPLALAASRGQLHLPSGELLLGYVGAIFPRDARLMAEAFTHLRRQLPAARLLLIGYFNAPVERMVPAPGAVIRTGVVSRRRLNQYLAASDLCWLPYQDSGANRGRWPMKLNDYMSAGRATVASAVGDVAEVMSRHAVGLLAPPTPAALAETVLQLWARANQRHALGRNARRVAEAYFSWQQQATRLEAVYARVL